MSTTTEYAVEYQRIKSDVHRRIVEMLDVSRLSHWPEDRLRHEMRGLASRLLQDSTEELSSEEQGRLADEVIDEAFGLGPLESLLEDETITDILVNGPRDVYVERFGQLQKTSIVFADEQHLMQVIQRIASRIGRRVDEASPMVDARLPDGSRVNAVVRPLALEGPFLSIRRFGVRLTVDDLLHYGSLPEEAMTFLQAAVESRISILVSGGTGSGKTTLLNSLSRFIPEEERLVTVEDAAELLLQQPHVVRMETRPANMEGAGEVRQRDLVRNSLRMRPDRIIVGEVRGAEVLDMLQAMNTGHEGSLTTVHANDARDALARLEMMVMMAGFDLPVPVIRQYIASAITLVVHVSRLKGGKRRMTKLAEVTGLKDGRYKMRDLFLYQQLGVRNGHAFGNFTVTGKKPNCLSKLIACGIQLPENLFDKRIIPGPIEEIDTDGDEPSPIYEPALIHPFAMLDYRKEHGS